jgi:hypothetical protein
VDNHFLFSCAADSHAVIFIILTPHGQRFAGHDDWYRNKSRRGKISFSPMKPQQFDHDDRQMMPPQQQSTKYRDATESSAKF